jgi:hypothetical protein
MVFDPKSRYASVPDAELTTLGADGEMRTLRYKRRRFLPPPDAQTVVAEHTVRLGERLDHIAATYVGDPTQYWRICDANLVTRPDELTDEPGARIRIGMALP